MLSAEAALTEAAFMEMRICARTVPRRNRGTTRAMVKIQVLSGKTGEMKWGLIRPATAQVKRAKEAQVTSIPGRKGVRIFPARTSAGRIGAARRGSSVFRSLSPAKLSEVMMPEIRRGIRRKNGSPMIFKGRTAIFCTSEYPVSPSR